MYPRGLQDVGQPVRVLGWLLVDGFHPLRYGFLFVTGSEQTGPQVVRGQDAHQRRAVSLHKVTCTG